MNDMNKSAKRDVTSGAESYRAFLDKFVEYGGNPELIKGLAPKAQPTKSRLPHVSTESDALAFARLQGGVRVRQSGVQEIRVA